MISLPSRLTGAAAPLVLGLIVEHIGRGAPWISVLASVSASNATASQRLSWPVWR
jgi:hypothetical protein